MLHSIAFNIIIMLTTSDIFANHISFRKIVGFLDTETAVKVSKLWKHVKKQQVVSVRFLKGACGFGIERVTLNYPGIERITLHKKLLDYFDNKDVDIIANNCRQLKKIDISKCENITSITNLTRNCQELTYIKARGCYQLNDDSMKDIANNCYELEHIDVAYCPDITDAGVVSVVDNCPNLTAINISGCGKITDRAIIAIAELCPDITSISLADCFQVSDAAVKKLSDQCKKLKFIYLRGCCNMSPETIASVTKKCIGVSELSYTM